jgi:hypothetical protein
MHILVVRVRGQKEKTGLKGMMASVLEFEISLGCACRDR